MTHSLEESLDDSTGTLPGIPRLDVAQVIAGIQHQLSPLSREARLQALATVAAAYIADDPGLGADAIADDAARVVAALERFA